MKKTILIILGAIIFSFSNSHARAPSVLGATRLNTNHVHHVGLGWPSLFYEYWMGASSMDWAIGTELIYGDYVGELSDVDIGFGLNLPMRWNLSDGHNLALAFRLSPGMMIADSDGALFGFRSEFGLPVSVKVHQDVHLVTGVNVPFALLFPDQGDSITYIPIFARIGAEFRIMERVIPSMLLELGPVIRVGNGNSDTEFGVRVWASTMLF